MSETEIMASYREAARSWDDEVSEGLSRLLHDIDEQMIANLTTALIARHITPTEEMIKNFLNWAHTERCDAEGVLGQVLLRAGYVDTEAR